MAESTPDAGERSDDGSNDNPTMNGSESKTAATPSALPSTMDGNRSTMNGNHAEPKEGDSISALEWKKKGNVFFANEDWTEAMNAYRCGLVSLQEERQAPTQDETDAQSESISPTSITEPIPEPTKADPLEVALRSNLAFVLLKLQQYDQAETECNQVLKIAPGNSKGALSNSFTVWLFFIFLLLRPILFSFYPKLCVDGRQLVKVSTFQWTTIRRPKVISQMIITAQRIQKEIV